MVSSRSIGVAVAAALLSLGAGPAWGPSYHSDRFGFSLRVPASWKQVPLDVVRKTTRDSDDDVHLIDSGFVPNSTTQPMSIPFVLVKVITYEESGETSAVTEADMKELAESLSRQSPAGGVKVGGGYYDSSRHRVVATASLPSNGNTRHVTVVHYFGRDAVVKLTYCGLEKQHADARQDAMALIDSFRFDPEKAYSAAAAGSGSATQSDASSTEEEEPEDNRSRRFRKKATTGGVIGTIVAAAIYFLRKWNNEQ